MEEDEGVGLGQASTWGGDRGEATDRGESLRESDPEGTLRRFILLLRKASSFCLSFCKAESEISTKQS